MDWITIEHDAPERRDAVRGWLAGLDLLSPAVAEKVVTAWVSAWASSSFATLAAMPYSPMAPGYRLMDHVNEVTRIGIDLSRRAEAEWGQTSDPDILVPILILHDVDKPLLYTRDGDSVGHTRLYKELPHGVPGAILLRELGFDHQIVSTVATHASNAPFHGDTLEAYVLHYADYFSTDHALMLTRAAKPFYQRHWQ